MPVWRGEGQFLDLLKADEEVTLSDEELEALFNLDYHFKHVEDIFARVFWLIQLPKRAVWIVRIT